MTREKLNELIEKSEQCFVGDYTEKQECETNAFKAGAYLLREPLLKALEALKLSVISEKNQERLEQVDKWMLIQLLLHLHHVASDTLAEIERMLEAGK